MTQEVGETSKAIVEDDEKQVEKILSENQHRREPYWIVICARPSKVNVEGKPTLLKVIKPYFKKPRPMVGMITGEVDNVSSRIKWEVNMPDKPFGYHLLGLEDNGVHTYETSIPGSYLYN